MQQRSTPISSDWINLVRLALREDLGPGQGLKRDRTTHALFSAPRLAAKAVEAALISKESRTIVLCGLPLVAPVFRLLGCRAKLTSNYEDGDTVAAGEEIARLRAPVAGILAGERTLLNLLRHLSGIATLTATYVEKVSGTRAKILDTRKTTPGLRSLEKYAVRCGGGVNHRQGLFDGILVKNNHLDFLGGVAVALAQLPNLGKSRGKTRRRQLPVIFEVRSAAELEAVIRYGKDKIERVLLDNLPLPELRECVSRAQGFFTTEVSGGVTLESVRAIAETGVDFISVGEITHSARCVDLALHIATSSA